MIYKAILFDLDGTLLDTLEDLARAVNRALAAFSLPCLTAEAVKVRIGDGVRMLISRCVPSGTDPALTEKVLERFRDIYLSGLVESTRPYPGIERLIKTLSAMKIPSAIVTNKDETLAKQLAGRFFPGVFKAVCGQTPDSRPKPDPDIPSRALKALGASGREALLIGDSLTDLMTAKNCGASFIYAAWGYGDRQSVCGEKTAESADEVLEAINLKQLDF